MGLFLCKKMTLDDKNFPEEDFCSVKCSTSAWRNISYWIMQSNINADPEYQSNQEKMIAQERRKHCEPCMATLHERHQQSKSHSH